MQKYRSLERRYGAVINVDTAVEKAKRELGDARSRLDSEEGEARTRLASLGSQYAEANAIFDRLRRELALVEENVEDVSIALYRPHYDFATSELYKIKLDAVRTQVKLLVRDDDATVCANNWSINGSQREGAKQRILWGASRRH